VTYLTGDLGRMRADGCLHHLGRKDQQVKIRGNRVELAEIESALLALPTVKEAVVTARADHTGVTGLVAYVVPERGGPLSIGELRHALAARVPDYMLPSAYVRLDTLPLTAGGKVDRRALGRSRAPAAGARRRVPGAPHRHGRGLGGDLGPACSASTAWASTTRSSISGATRSPRPGSCRA
jgi:acyl-coenzyme A synthetase/AMP-(fatty) acid ligase